MTRAQFRILLLVACTVAASAACGADHTANTDRAMRSDSAGVSIVVTDQPDRALPWTFTERAVYVDSAGEPFLFKALFTGALSVDRAGNVYALDRDNWRVVVFDSAGREHHAFGKQGGGPGEFQFPMNVDLDGDTVVVTDPMRGALIRWLVTGAVVPEQRLSGRLGQTQGGVRFAGDVAWFAHRSIADSLDRTELIAIHDGDTSVVVAQSAPAGRPVQFKCFGLSSAQQLFSPSLNWSSSDAGVAVNRQAGYVIDVYDNGGRLKRSVRRRVDSRAPTAEDVRRLYPDGMKVSFGGGRGCTVPVEELMEKQGIADALPTIHEVQLFADGTIWARRSIERDSAFVYDVFAADGAYLGTAKDVRPLWAVSNGELLVARDDRESGGKTLVRMRVSR